MSFPHSLSLSNETNRNLKTCIFSIGPVPVGFPSALFILSQWVVMWLDLPESLSDEEVRRSGRLYSWALFFILLRRAAVSAAHPVMPVLQSHQAGRSSSSLNEDNERVQIISEEVRVRVHDRVCSSLSSSLDEVVVKKREEGKRAGGYRLKNR